ncbi:hypothetical protein BDZ89DRAFT_1131962 [Hymenopellis radicata]|nr:hypothetical protein BDZ89DRAFT_1131962 [Hymenopellis radicata]
MSTRPCGSPSSHHLATTMATTTHTDESYIPTTLPPTLHHLLRSNEQPSPHEEVLIGEMTRLVDTLLFATNVSIACTSTLVDLDGADSDMAIFLTEPAPSQEQKDHQATLQKLRDELQTFHAPVRRLPREILQEIFLAIDTGVDVFNDADPHYVVGRVCREWRAVSRHSCPQMWCLLDLEGAAQSTTAIESRLFSLYIPHFDDDDDPSIYKHDTFIVLLGVLGQYSMQWESAHFFGLRINEAHVLSVIRGRVPLLKTLVLQMEDPDIAVDRVCRAFEIAPKLAHVRLHKVPLGHIALARPNLQMISIDYGAIYRETILSYSRGTPPLHEILRLSPNLRTVNINRIILPAWENTEMDMTWPPYPVPPCIVYTDLVSLESSDFVSFYHISLPNLKDLCVGPDSLHPEDDSLVDFLPAVAELLQHSHCRLSRLTLQHGAWSLDALREVLGLVPEVEEISVVYGNDEAVDVAQENMLESLIEALRVGEFRASSESDVENDVLERRPKYLSRLKTLAIKTSRWEWVNKEFVEMVAIRRGKDGLGTVRLVCEQNADEHPEVFSNLERCDWDRLRNMKKAGLNLTFWDIRRPYTIF